MFIQRELDILKENFEKAMNDDLNTSIALSVMFELVRETQKLLEKGDTNKQTLEVIDGLFTKLGGDVLGIVKDEYPQAAGGNDELTDKLVNVLIDQRNEARKVKDFAKADGLRNKLDEMGIVLEDMPEKTTWRMK